MVEILAWPLANPSGFMLFSTVFPVKCQQITLVRLGFFEILSHCSTVNPPYKKGKGAVNSSKMSASTLKTTQCQPRRLDIETPNREKTNILSNINIDEKFMVFWDDAK